MAIKVLRTSKADIASKLSVKYFQIDTESDVGNLPNQSSGAKACGTGSKAVVLSPGNGKSPERILTEAGVWVESPHRIIIDCGTPITR